jgi:hypothetical protein
MKLITLSLILANIQQTILILSLSMSATGVVQMMRATGAVF